MRTSTSARIMLLLLAGNAWACEQLLGIETGQPGGGNPSDGGGGAGAAGGTPAGGAAGGGAEGLGGGGMIPASYRDVVLGAEPVAYWRLDEAAGSTIAANATLNPYDGEYSAAVELEQPGLITEDNASVQFDGASDVAIGNHLAFASRTPFTVEAWVRPTDGGFGEIVGKSNTAGGWRLFVSSNDTQFRRETALSSQGALGRRLAEGVTSYVVGRYDGATICLFVSGVEIQCKASNLSIPGGNARLLLGGSFAGWVDEVAIYPRALDDAEIAEHYAIGTRAVR